MARVFRFLNSLGSELYTINDPNDQLPIPEVMQVISIGSSRMRVESVTFKRIDGPNPQWIYHVRIRTIGSNLPDA